jgi:hypothetical protein
LAISAVLSGSPSFAQTPAAPESLVNTHTADGQFAPFLSMDARGNFVVVWNSIFQDGSGSGVFGQRFDAAGVRVGGEFLVNNTTPGQQLAATVAVARRGDFVVAWEDQYGDIDIKARRYDRSGAALGAEFRVNAYTPGAQRFPSVAYDAAGNFVVVWGSAHDGDAGGVFGRRFGASGNPIGAEFTVNSYTTGFQGDPRVVGTAGGGFVVVFVGEGGSDYLHARRFDAGGSPIGAEFSVTTSGAGIEPAVAALPQGGFVVVWTSYLQDGSSFGVFGRAFDAQGLPLTPEIPVNSFTTDAQAFPAVAVDGQGGVVVIWESTLQDGSSQGVFGQRFTAEGARRGAEFRLNAYTTGSQAGVTVAADSAGNFTGAWGSDGQDNSSFAVIAERFQGLLPASLALDTAPPGNGVFEPNETVNFAPGWRNGTAATQTFQGTLSSLTGPTPAEYTILDAAASYGPLAAGAAQSCSAGSNCYSLMITAATRPAAHWDASVMETPSGVPNADGLQKRWVVHLGDSFTDVPRTSAFYRFVETVLHHGVTSGCAAGTFCPTSSTARDQMAVFVLVAREGAGYRPPDCGTPIFNDVPASSGFCRYVEELARRGVVGGCGGGNYCPSSPVTREQLCVFVLRTLDPTFTPPACGTPVFNDVPADSPFCPWIEELFRRGVVSGCGGGNFCGNVPVTREQTSVFLAAAFGLTLYGI